MTENQIYTVLKTERMSQARVFVINACFSEAIGVVLSKRYPEAAIIAIKKKQTIEDEAAKKFTKHFYKYLF